MINSGIRILPRFSPPGEMHFIRTESFATVEEVLDIDFERGVSGDLLHHPGEGDIGETVGWITSTDGLMGSSEPGLFQNRLFVV